MDNKNERKLVVTEQYTLEYGGPLPPAAEYERYEHAFPGTAKGILKMAEVEAAHRREIEWEELNIKSKYQSRGQLFAFTIGMASLCAAVLCAFLNQAVVAVVPAILGCVSLAAVFLGKNKK